jgi:hypothetical protein
MGKHEQVPTVPLTVGYLIGLLFGILFGWLGLMWVFNFPEDSALVLLLFLFINIGTMAGGIWALYARHAIVGEALLTMAAILWFFWAIFYLPIYVYGEWWQFGWFFEL